MITDQSQWNGPLGDICQLMPDGGGDASDETADRIEALTAQLAERDAEIISMAR